MGKRKELAIKCAKAYDKKLYSGDNSGQNCIVRVPDATCNEIVHEILENIFPSNDKNTKAIVSFFLNNNILHNGVYKFDYRKLGDIAECIYTISDSDKMGSMVSERLLGNSKTYRSKRYTSCMEIEKGILARIKDIPVVISNTGVKSNITTLVKAAKCGVVVEYDDKAPTKRKNVFFLPEGYSMPKGISSNRKKEYLNFVKCIIYQIHKKFMFEGNEISLEKFLESIKKIALENNCKNEAEAALVAGWCVVRYVMGEIIDGKVISEYIEDFHNIANKKTERTKKSTIEEAKEYVRRVIELYEKYKDDKEYFTEDQEATPEIGWIDGSDIFLAQTRNEKGKAKKADEVLMKYIGKDIKFNSVRAVLKESGVIETDKGYYMKSKDFIKKRNDCGNRAVCFSLEKARELIEV